MAIYLFSQILKLTEDSIKLIENLSRRHLITSSDVFVIMGFTGYCRLPNSGYHCIVRGGRILKHSSINSNFISALTSHLKCCQLILLIELLSLSVQILIKKNFSEIIFSRKQ